MRRVYSQGDSTVCTVDLQGHQPHQKQGYEHYPDNLAEVIIGNARPVELLHFPSPLMHLGIGCHYHLWEIFKHYLR